MIFRVKVEDPKIFNAFIVRPKICDELSHCFDFYYNKVDFDSDKVRTYHTNFFDISGSNYVRLLFYVEYFKYDHKDNDITVDFDIELVHFGEPCYGEKLCGDHGKCIVTDNPKANEIYCGDCDDDYTGDDCNTKDYCMSKTGSQLNEEFCNADNQQNGECENLKSGFRCTCGNGEFFWKK